MKKRFLSILLAALMLLSLLPVSALAAQPMQHLGFSLSGMTLDLINAEDHGGFLRYSYTCTVMFSDAVYQMGSPEYLGYWYGAEEEDMDFPLSDGNGHTLTVNGKWGVEKLEAGQTDVTVPVELDIDADDYAAAPSGTYTGPIVLDALVLGTRASDNSYCYYIEEYATATVKLVIPGYDVNVSNPTGCTITADKRENIREGETVHVSYALDEGYYLQALSVTDAGGYSVPLSEDGAFTMPALNVTVTGATIPPHELTFMKAVGLMQDFDWFTPGADKSSPVRYGDTVNLSVDIDEDNPDSLGWFLDHWEVKNPETGQIVELNADGCSFSMPNFDVRAVPILKYEDPNHPGTGTIVDPDPGIGQVTERFVQLWRNDGTNTLPPYITLRTEGDFLKLPNRPFTHEGWTLRGWAKNADSRLPDYDNAQTVNLTDIPQGGGLALYALWNHQSSYTFSEIAPIEVAYRAESAEVTFELTALEPGFYDGTDVSAIRLTRFYDSFSFADDPVFSAPGSRTAVMEFNDKLWRNLSPGQQTAVIRYFVDDLYGNRSHTIERRPITLLIDVPEKYAVTVADGITRGSVTLQHDVPYAEGETVKLSVQPNKRCILDEGSLTGSYTDGTGEVHTVEITGSGKSYSFTMPAYPVTVTASFSPLVSAGSTPEPETFTVPVRLVDADTGEGMADIALKLTAPDGTERISVSDAEGFADFSDVTPCGDSDAYTLTMEGNEVYDPASVEFYLLENGRIVSTGTVDESGCLLLPVTKKTVGVRIDAVDADGNRLEGAVMQILNADGNVVDEWTSGSELFCVEGLTAGEEYALRVTCPPQGSLIPADTTFSIESDGSVSYNGNTETDGEGNLVLLVEFEWTHVRIDTVDADGNRLAGAVIYIYDPDGEPVEEWTSSDNETHCRDGLFTGAEFTLHADSAPEGYLLPADTIFSLNADGSVEYSGNTETDGEGNPVLLVEFEKTRVSIDAVDADGNRLEGAVMQILNADGDVVDEWTSGSELYCVEGLTAGEEYALLMAIPADGYCVWPETRFTIEFDGSVTYGGNTATDGEGKPVLLVELTPTRVCFSVRDADTGEAIPDVRVHITDYAGSVITDWISDDTGYHAVERLSAGVDYTVRVIDAPEDYLPPEDASFAIDPEGNVTYSGNIGTNNIFETLLLVELKGVSPAYRLGGENVMFFDENSRRITWAREGQTVIVSPVFETIPAGYWFTGTYKAVPAAVEITVDEVGDGTFTMPAEAVTVSLVLAGQEDYDLLLADGDPAALPADMAANLSGTGAYFYDETLDAGVLDLNGDGEPDVLLDFDADTAQRLAGADAITHSVTLSIDAPVPYRYRAVCFRFDENQSAGPVIRQQPADVSVALGELARTTVVAEGEGLNYQWYGREANGRVFKSGLRGDTYSVALVKSKIGRTVWCVITDAEGNTATTREAVLNVAYPDDYVYPTITADAADCFVDAGGTASVTIGAEGCGELSYQWYILNKGSQTWAKSGIKGVGADTYSCAMNGTRDGRQIYCVVTDAWGNTATSSTVTIGFDCPAGYEGPSVTVNADDIHTDVDAGEYASVTVTAAGPNGDAEGLSYQWYLRADENAPWSRSSLKGDTYSVKMVPSKSGRQVKCVVTDAYGKKTESAVFTLTMVIPAEYHGPSITGQPGNVTVARGEIASTTVAAEGAGLSYQWYFRANENAPWSRSSLKGVTYSVKMIPSKSGRQVRCVVTDKYGLSVKSEIATLTMGQ